MKLKVFKGEYMSIKRKLITTIALFCLTIALIAVGIWAAGTGVVSIGGSVGFEAEDVYCKITGEVKNADKSYQLSELNYSAALEPDADQLNTWKNDLDFTEEGTPITIEITIENLSDERSIFVSLTDDLGNQENIEKSIKQDSADYVSGTTYELKKGETVVYTISFGLVSTDFSADAQYKYTVRLIDEKEYANQ